jgi:hypothetical protein
MQSVGESCIGAIDEEKEEEIRGANIIMFNGIDRQPVACGCRTTQQPTAKSNRIERESIEFVSQFGEQ